MWDVGIIDQHGLYPFHICPDTKTLHTLADFGYCFVVKNYHSTEYFLNDFCKNTSLSMNDFEDKYIYYGTSVLVTRKQAEFRESLDQIVNNVKANSKNLDTWICCPQLETR